MGTVFQAGKSTPLIVLSWELTLFSYIG